MSIACKCERCGKFYEPNKDDEAQLPVETSPLKFNTITLNYKCYETDNLDWVGFTQIDICPECAHSFVKWWMGSDE